MGNLCRSFEENELKLPSQPLPQFQSLSPQPLPHFQIEKFDDLKRIVTIEDEAKRHHNSLLASLLSRLPQSMKNSWLMESMREDVSVTQLLLDARADPNCEDKDGHIPLTCWVHATTANHYKILINAKADVNKKRNGDWSPLYCATSWIDNDNVELIRVLLGSRADVNEQDPFKRQTALMVASEKGHLEQVKTLLNFKASPYVTDRIQRTALSYTAFHRDRYLHISELLQECPRKRMVNVLSMSLPLPTSGGHYLLHDRVCVFSGD